MEKNREITLIFFLLVLIIFVEFCTPKITFATYIIDGAYLDCPTTCSSPDPGTCAKSEPWNCPSCGTTSDDCCQNIEPWQKYDAKCKQITAWECNWAWVYDTRICSTADKCIVGETGLRTGYRDWETDRKSVV